jgi:hypothetical protein
MPKFTVNLPSVGRGRLIGTATASTVFSGLWMAPGLLGFPGADLSPKLVVVGLLVPYGIGAWSLAWAERRVRHESLPVRDDFPQRALESQRDRAGAR